MRSTFSLHQLAATVADRIYDAPFLLFACISLYIFYLLIDRAIFTYRIRSRYTDIVCLPRHWLWGNLVNAGRRLDPSLPRHPDYGFEEIWEELGHPPCYLMDLAPVDRSFLIVAHPEAAEAIIQPSPLFKYSVTKSDTYVHLKPLVGKESILTQEDEDWKHLRRRFNPGFQPKHIHSLAPSIVSLTRIFLDRLKTAAKNREIFALADYAKDLTTDVITQLTIEKNLNAQSTPEGTGEKGLFGILTASRRLSELVYKSGRGLNPLYFLDFRRPIKAFFYEQIYDRKLSAIVAQQIRGVGAGSSLKSASPSRSITQLATTGMAPTNDLIRNTVHQIKTFLFAGQDTTATLVQWLCYELSRAVHDSDSAEILHKLQEEHNAVFPASSPWSALDVLSSSIEADFILGSQLPYTAAFVKETLRLHPPAATARLIQTAPGVSTSFHVPISGVSTCIDGMRIYICQWIIHRNPAIWGADALAFRPDRWLDESYIANLPAGAWRPFERGPRNCIGQELAMMEGKVVLCAVARGLRWEKIGMTGRNGEEEMYSKHEVTSVPVDGMKMRVSLVGEQK